MKKKKFNFPLCLIQYKWKVNCIIFIRVPK